MRKNYFIRKTSLSLLILWIANVMAIFGNSSTVTAGASFDNGASGAAGGPTSSVFNAAVPSIICSGSSANLIVTITGGTSPFTIVYSDGSSDFTVNGYSSGANIPVSPTVTTTYSLVSVTDASLSPGTGNLGTPTITVYPAGDVNQPANLALCNNSPAVVNFSGSSAATIFNWINNTPSVGFAATGTGNIPSFTATNSTNTPVTATVTVTPTSGNFAYISNFGSGNVSVINIATNKVVATITVGSEPEGVSVSPDGSRVYVANFGSNTLSAINTATNSVLTSIPVGSGPIGVSVSPDGTHVYVVNQGSNSVSVINTSSNEVTSTISVGFHPTGISVSPNGSRLYVANNSSNTVSLINTATDLVLTTIPVGAQPNAVAVNPDGSDVYITNSGSQTVSVINTVSNSVVATIPVGSNPQGISVSPDGSRAYVANYTSGDLSVINTATGLLVTNISLDPGIIGVSVSPDGSLVYVANNEFSQVYLINTSTNTKVTSIAAGSFPDAFGNFITGSPSACAGASKTFTITVDPTPTVTCPNLSVCGNAAPFALTGGSPAGGTYSGANVSNGVFNPLTAGVGAHTVNYFYKDGDKCTNSCNFTVTVFSTQNVNAPPDQTVCNNTATNPVNFSGSAAGTIFNWTNNTPSIGLAVNGSGNIPSFTATNSTNTPVTAIVTVTPSSGNFAYVANFNSNNVSVINISTNQIVSTIPVGANPYGVSASPDGSRVYVTDYSSDAVSVINTSTDSVIATVAVGNNPEGVSVSPDGSHVYIANSNDGTVSVINTSDNSVAAVTVGTNPFGLSVSPDGSRVYVTNFNGGNVSVINTSNNVVLGTVSVGSSPWGVSVSPDGTRVYVANNGSGTVSIINAAADTVITTVPVGLNPIGISVSPDGSRVYIANNGSNSVSVINTITNAVMTTVPVGSNPLGVSVSPDGSRLYVANNHSGNVSVINTATNAVVSTLSVGSSPTAFGNFIIGGLSVCTGASKTFTITVNTAPAISCPGDQAANTSGSCNAIVNYSSSSSGSPAPTISYVFSGATSGSGSGNGSGSTFNLGTTVVTLTATDSCGKTVTCTFNVVVTDAQAPVPDITSLPAITGQCSATVSSAPTATDNCAGSITGTTTDPLTHTTQGTFTIHWTYSDGNGNSSTQNQTVTVKDITAPIPDIASLPTISGQCSATVTSAPTATDNCAGSVTGTTTDPLTYTASGTFTIHWTYSDGNGNTSEQDQTVVVQGSSAPVPDIAPLPTITGQCSASVTSAPTATAGCVGSITGTTTDPLTYTTQGTFTIHWTYSDGNGHTAEQDQTVIVKDITAPVPDITSLPTISGQCSATVTSAPTATDNCAGSVTGTSTDPLTYTTSGTFTIHWTYSDGNGNSSTQNQTVVVQGSTAPVPDINPLPTIAGQCSATVSSVPTATAGCVGSIKGTTTDPLIYTTQGAFTIHWTYSDGNGHTVEQDQTVTVNDVTNPTITAPSNVNVTVNSAACSATGVNLGTPVTGDNCAVQKVTNNAPASFPLGTTTVTWVVTDIHGLTATAPQTVIVSSTLNASLSTGSASCSGGTLTVTATGGGGSYTYSLDGINYQPGNTFAVSPGTYTITVKDIYGCTKKTNSITVTQSAGITASSSAGTISCFGGTTTLTITASGGKTPYSYSINGTSFQTSNKFTLAAGAYTVTVKDANGCKTTSSGTIAQPAVISISLSAGTISCYGATTTLTITATGGTPAYTYSLNGCTFQSKNTFTASATTCAVTVKDSKGCTAVKSLNISQPAAISVAASATPVLCNGGTSTVTVSATGGTPPYTGTGTFTKAAGTYTFNINDSKNCSGNKTITISQPAVLTVSLSTKTMILCYGSNTGSITVKGAGGTQPYTYKINTATSYQSSPTFNNLTVGTYSVTVKDNNGCSAVVTGISITQPATALALTLSKKTDASCATAANGIITVSATGGTSPLKYSLNSGSYGTSNTFSSLRAGTYTVNAKDANSCIKSITVVINGTGKCNNLSVTDPEITVADLREGTWLKAIVSPNPSEAEFTLTLTGNSNEPVEVRVIDMYGRAVHFARGSANQSYQFGQRFAKGMYVIEILQGKFLKTAKIIKGN